MLMTVAPLVSFSYLLIFSISKCAAPCQTEGIGSVRSNKQHAYDDEEGEFNYAQDDKLPIPKRASTYKSQIPNHINHSFSFYFSWYSNKPTDAYCHGCRAHPESLCALIRFMPKIKLGGKKNLASRRFFSSPRRPRSPGIFCTCQA